MFSRARARPTSIFLALSTTLGFGRIDYGHAWFNIFGGGGPGESVNQANDRARNEHAKEWLAKQEWATRTNQAMIECRDCKDSSDSGRATDCEKACETPDEEGYCDKCDAVKYIGNYKAGQVVTMNGKQLSADENGFARQVLQRGACCSWKYDKDKDPPMCNRVHITDVRRQYTGPKRPRLDDVFKLQGGSRRVDKYSFHTCVLVPGPEETKCEDCGPNVRQCLTTSGPGDETVGTCAQELRAADPDNVSPPNSASPVGGGLCSKCNSLDGKRAGACCLAGRKSKDSHCNSVSSVMLSHHPSYYTCVLPEGDKYHAPTCPGCAKGGGLCNKCDRTAATKSFPFTYKGACCTRESVVNGDVCGRVGLDEFYSWEKLDYGVHKLGDAVRRVRRKDFSVFDRDANRDIEPKLTAVTEGKCVKVPDESEPKCENCGPKVRQCNLACADELGGQSRFPVDGGGQIGENQKAAPGGGLCSKCDSMDGKRLGACCQYNRASADGSCDFTGLMGEQSQAKQKAEFGDDVRTSIGGAGFGLKLDDGTEVSVVLKEVFRMSADYYTCVLPVGPKYEVGGPDSAQKKKAGDGNHTGGGSDENDGEGPRPSPGAQDPSPSPDGANHVEDDQHWHLDKKHEGHDDSCACVDSFLETKESKSKPGCPPCKKGVGVQQDDVSGNKGADARLNLTEDEVEERDRAAHAASQRRVPVSVLLERAGAAGRVPAPTPGAARSSRQQPLLNRIDGQGNLEVLERSRTRNEQRARENTHTVTEEHEGSDEREPDPRHKQQAEQHEQFLEVVL